MAEPQLDTVRVRVTVRVTHTEEHVVTAPRDGLDDDTLWTLVAAAEPFAELAEVVSYEVLA